MIERKDVQQEKEHIFMLIGEKNRIALYNTKRRMVLINTFNEKGVESRSKVMTPLQNVLLSYFIANPNTFTNYRSLLEVSHPDAVWFPQNTEYAAETMRPALCRLRDKLSVIDPEIANCIQTKRGEGIVYVPHQSVAAWNKNHFVTELKKDIPQIEAAF